MALATALFASPLVVPAQAETAKPREVVLAEKLGREIFLHDKAAWQATDALLESPGKADATVRGWITLEVPGGWLVRFIRQNGVAPCAAVDVTLRAGSASVVAPEPCQTLEGAQLARYNARATAVQQLDERCTAQYNTVVLPGALMEKSGWLVYLLAATTTPGEVVVGGHYRFLVSGDGREVLEKTRLSKSCLTLPPPPKEGKPAGAVASHVISPYPIETHVFLSLQHENPLYVLTEKGLWRASEGQITFLMTPDELKKARANVNGGD